MLLSSAFPSCSRQLQTIVSSLRSLSSNFAQFSLFPASQKLLDFILLLLCRTSFHPSEFHSPHFSAINEKYYLENTVLPPPATASPPAQQTFLFCMVLSPSLIFQHCLLLWRCSLLSARCNSCRPRLLSVPLLLCHFCACTHCTHEVGRWMPWLRIPSLLLEILEFCHFRAQSHGKLRENPLSNLVLPLPPCSNPSF